MPEKECLHQTSLVVSWPRGWRRQEGDCYFLSLFPKGVLVPGKHTKVRAEASRTCTDQLFPPHPAIHSSVAGAPPLPGFSSIALPPPSLKLYDKLLLPKNHAMWSVNFIVQIHKTRTELDSHLKLYTANAKRCSFKFKDTLISPCQSHPHL